MIHQQTVCVVVALPRRASSTIARLALFAAFAALFYSFAVGNHAAAQIKPVKSNAFQADPREKLFKVTGERWRITGVPEGSWCPSGHKVLEKNKPLTFGETTFELKGSTIAVSGVFKTLPAITTPAAFAPSTFFKNGEKKPATPKQVLTEKQLQAGIDVEVCGQNGVGLGVARCQSDWRGISCGTVSGWRFALEDDTRILVDADLDGGATYEDRVLYEGHPYWMPWHEVTCGPKYQYYDLSVAPEGLVTGRCVPLADMGDEAGVASEWNMQRLAAGVPPGVFDPALTLACQKHADYLKLNKLAVHEEDSSLPGYTKEGAQAGESSSITFEGKTDAVNGMFSTLYHRMAMLHPKYSTLTLGGNDYAYLLGIAGLPGGMRSALVSERRVLKFPTIHPAPNSAVQWTTLGREKPACVIYSDAKPVGYPVMIMLPEYFTNKDRTPPTGVSATVYAVEGALRDGKRTKAVKCHLSYPRFQAPAEDTENGGLIALTPYAPLDVGPYEVDCQFTYKGKDYQLHWRFEVVAKNK